MNVYRLVTRFSLFFILGTMFQNLYAEGTNPLSPTAADEVLLHTNAPGFANFASYNGPEVSRLYIHIEDFSTEMLYIGLSAEADDNGNINSSFEFRIKDPDGIVVHGPYLVTTNTQNCPTFALANAGPDVLDPVNGYNTGPAYASFDPSSVGKNGDYYIEFTDIPVASIVNVKWFDFTIVNGAGDAEPGRLWSNTWALRTPPLTGNPPECQWDRPFNGAVYTYTEDGFVSRIDFNNSGFQGLSFTIAFGETGPGNTGDIIEDRKSTNSGDSTANAADHMVFVNEPDPDIYTSPPDLCGDVYFLGESCVNDSICIEVGVTRAGQVEILLDFFGDNGEYDPETTDVILGKFFEEPDTACILWDGLKGDGTMLDFNEPIPATIRYSQGIQHYAAFDLEFLKFGFCIETIRPVCDGQSNLLYWDDSEITDNVSTPFIDESDPGTGQPLVQLNGCICQVGGCRTWDNFQLGSNPATCDGAPAGYGDFRTLNTWWFAASQTIGPFDLVVVRAQIVGDTVICPGDSTTLMVEANPDTIAYDITWTGPNGFMATTASTGFVSDPGIYTVTILDPLTNCSATESVELVVADPIITMLDFMCLGGNSPNADIDLTVSGGTPPYMYLWNTGAMTEDLMDVPPGEYSVIVTDDQGCMAFDTIVVAQCCTLDIACPSPDGGQFNCVDDIPAPDTTLVIINDFCTSVSVTVQESDNGGGGCVGDTLFVTRTYTVVDGLGNSSTCDQIFTVVDELAPVLDSGTCPADVSAECDASITPGDLGSPTFTDNCSDVNDITITFSDDSTGFDGSCTNSILGEITRTFYASDLCGNVDSSCVQTITIVDTQAPTFTTPPDLTILCTSDSLPATTGMVNDAEDNCTSVTIDFSDVIVSGECPAVDTILRTWVVEDACGNSSSGVQRIARIDSEPPTFTTPANVTIECDEDTSPANTGDVTDAADDCSGVMVTFSDNTNSGQCPVTEVITRTWVATDGCGNSATGVQTITLEDTTPPTFTTPADVTINCDEAPNTGLTGDVTDASDNCTGSGMLSISFSDVTVSGSCPAIDTIYRTWTVSDDCGNSSTGVQTITRVDVEGPTFTTPADVTIDCTESSSPDNTGTVDDAEDNCSANVTITMNDVTVTGECPAIDTLFRTWIVTDDCGNSSTGLQVIIREDNTPPTFTTPADVTIECDDDIDPSNTGTVEDANDICSDVTVDFSDVMVIGNCSATDSIYRTWIVTDECGNSSTGVQTITLIDTLPPIFTIPPDVTIDCTSDTLPSTTGDVMSSNDNCSMVTTSFSDNVVPGQCPAIDTIYRTWIAMDECGNSAMGVQVITREDNTPPTFTTPANVTIECDEDTSPANTGDITDAADDCSSVNAGFSDGVVSGSCPDNFTITRTWTVTDGCGNSSSGVQTITVQDTEAPEVVPGTCPSDTTIACDEMVGLFGTPSYTDNCGEVTVTFQDEIIGFVPPSNEGMVIRTFYAEDECGNIDSSCVQTITVVDLVPPMVTCPPDVSVVCGAPTDTSATGVPTVTDNCGEPIDIAVTFQDDSTGFAGACLDGVITRTFTCIDPDGNVSTCSQDISVFDTLAPTFALPANITVDCDIDLDDLSLVGNISDVVDCSAVVDTTYDDEFGMFGMPGCNGTGIIERTWMVTDACGNTGTGLQFITVQDTIAPNLTPPPDVTIDCTDDPGDTSLTGGVVVITDMCSMMFLLDYEDDMSGLDECGGTGLIVRSWFTQDDCENFTAMTQHITVVDNTPPVAVCQDITLNFDNGPVMTITPDMVDGGSFDECGPVSLSLSQSIFDCIQFRDEPVQTIQLIATDECGNTSSCDVNITGEGGGGILMQCQDDIYKHLKSGECGAYISYTVSAERRCGSNDPILVRLDTNGYESGDFFPIGEYEFSYVAYNDMGDTAYCAFMISVIENVQTTNVLACNEFVNISLNDDCEAFINPDWILEGGDFGCFDEFLVEVEGVGGGLGGVLVSNQNVTIGETYTVTITDTKTGNNCWSTILIEDKLPPVVECFDLEIFCTVPIEPVYGTPDSQMLPYAPPAFDNCSDVIYEYEDVLFESVCSLDSIHRTWYISDEAGNVTVCFQRIIVMGASLDDVEFPMTYEGDCNGASGPGVTGWPTISGVPITQNQLCNIWSWWEDKPITDCGGGSKILRRWTVMNACTGQLLYGTQLIKLSDNEGPVLTCPEPQTYSTDPWFCTADIALIPPAAVDACGSEFTMQPSVPLGVGSLVSAGGGAYRWENVPEGTWEVEWHAVDACGNTSSCIYEVTIEDDIPPVAVCDAHTVISLTEDYSINNGLTKIPASVFDNGSYDNCSDVTLTVRRLESCIDFDWTTLGAGIDEEPNGIVNSRDRGTAHGPKVPFSCCDAGQGPIMVELKVTDAEGNFSLCMVEVEVQDKLAPYIECPPSLQVSCDFWFSAEATAGFIPQEEDPLTPVFGRVLDAYEFDQEDRKEIVIDDPGNDEMPQPYTWGLEGWANDNCNVDIDVRVRIFDDCSGDNLPNSGEYPKPDNAVRMIERTFRATDPQGNNTTCRQIIWVVDYDPFYISDATCNNPDPNDGVRWPCDIELNTCPAGDLTPEDLNSQPVVFDDNCSIIGVTYKDKRFDFVEGACFKIIRTWTIIDWCQFDDVTGAGIWEYDQIIKVLDTEGAEFVECPEIPVELCVDDPNVELPANNQVFLGENDPNASSCSVHVRMERTVVEMCTGEVEYDVKVYPFNKDAFLQLVPKTTVTVESDTAVLTFDTKTSAIPAIRQEGLPYNSPYCDDDFYHRILWTVEDGCGNVTTCEYLFRLEDCKKPSPVCINGLSTVVMPASGEVTIWAEDFNASSFDDCTPAEELLYSFSGETYQPSRTFTCEDIMENGGSPSFLVDIWVADHGNDENCSGVITWDERNKDFCTTFIIVEDNENVCEGDSSGIAGTILTENSEPVNYVTVELNSSDSETYPDFITSEDGYYYFFGLPSFVDYSVIPTRNDNHKNGVSTLDLVRIQKHLLGMQPFSSPFKLIAADANNSSNITASDLIDIRKLVLGIVDEFPNNQSWRFVRAGFEFIDPFKPWPFDETSEFYQLNAMAMHTDFIGVKIGDVNGTAVAGLHEIEIRSKPEATALQIDEVAFAAGERVAVPVRAKEMQTFGWQLTLEHPGLNLVGILPGAVHVDASNYARFDEKLTMSVSTAEAVSVEDNTVLFTLEFQANRTGKLSDVLAVSSGITEKEIYLSDDQGDIVLHDLGLDFRAGKVGQETGREFALYQNQPNPWNGSTSIGFTLPQAMEVTLTIYDLSGKVLYMREMDAPAGYSEIVVTDRDVQGQQVMYYRLDASEKHNDTRETGGSTYSASKKMIMVR